MTRRLRGPRASRQAAAGTLIVLLFVAVAVFAPALASQHSAASCRLRREYHFVLRPPKRPPNCRGSRRPVGTTSSDS